MRATQTKKLKEGVFLTGMPSELGADRCTRMAPVGVPWTIR